MQKQALLAKIFQGRVASWTIALYTTIYFVMQLWLMNVSPESDLNKTRRTGERPLKVATYLVTYKSANELYAN